MLENAKISAMETFLTTTPVAHRGLHGKDIPENSLAAFRAAAEHGYAVETDVRLSKDGVLFVFHDDTLERMTGDKRTFADCTAQEISTLRLEGGQRIPTLEECLRYIDGAVPILLEIKNAPSFRKRIYIAKIAAAFAAYAGEYAVQSFVPSYVKEYKRACPHVACGILATASSCKADFGNSPVWKIKAHAVKHMSFNRIVKPDFISYRFCDYPQKATEEFKGVKLGWTVRSEEEEAYARKYCDNIIFEGYLPA